MDSSDIVKLDVGGTVFKTSRSTLTKYGGFFKMMFESGIPLKTDESGSIFIDRSAKYFDVVLNFFRDGKVPVPEDKYTRAQILQEAQYYMIDGLIYLCGGEPSREWKRANVKPEKPETHLHITACHEKLKVFQKRFKAFGGTKTHGLVICFNSIHYEDMSNDPKVIDFVEKHSDKWDILFFSKSDYKLYGHICYQQQSSIYKPTLCGQSNGANLILFFEMLKNHLAEKFL